MNEHVTGGAEGADETGIFRIVAQFFAQRGNVDVDAAVENLVIALADFLQQLIPRLYAAGGARKS